MTLVFFYPCGRALIIAELPFPCPHRLHKAGGANGAPLIIVRCGELGSVAVHGQESVEVVQIPIVSDSAVLDVTVSVGWRHLCLLSLNERCGIANK